MTRRRTRIAVGAAVLLVVVAAILAFAASRNSDGQQSGDSALRRTADIMVPVILRQKSDLPGATFIDVLHRYLVLLQAALTKEEPHLVPAGQLVQVQVYDPASSPPQDLGLNAPGHQFVTVGIATITQASKTSDGLFTNGRAPNSGARVYVRALRLPNVFTRNGVIGVIEVVNNAP